MEPLVNKRRWGILGVAITLTFMSCLDASIVNIAIPDMSGRLNVSTASITWVVTVYLIVITAFIIFFGKLADLIGKRRVFLFGLVVFTAGSLLCGIAGSLPILLVARALQAIGAGAGMSSNQGIIAEVFPATERGRALGMTGVAVALGNMAGPAIGGLIVSYLNWHYIFLINIPVGVVALFFGARLLPHDEKKLESRRQLDAPGIITFALSIITLFLAISEGEVIGYLQPFILALIAAAVVLFVFFVRRERRTASPMLDLSIFKNRLFSLSVFCAFINFWVTSCSNLILPFYLQDLLGLEAHVAGLIILASPVVLMAVAPISGHMSDKIGSEILTFIGLVILAVSFVLMGLLMNRYTAVVPILLMIALSALGNGMFSSPNTSLIMSTVPRNKYGIAGSINALVRNAGMVFGVSFSSVFLYNRISAVVGYKVLTLVPDQPNSFVYAMHWVFLVTAGICMLGVILTGFRLWGRRRRMEKLGDAAEPQSEAAQ